MARLASGALLALAVASAAYAQGNFSAQRSERNDVPLTANPSKVIATELAFARTALEKGQWTAFAQFAAKEAVMFTPQTVMAHDWLKGRANPAVAVKWQPHQVWSSCDGSLAVTKGAWQRPQGVGYFSTVWARQKDGNYKWVMDGGDSLKEPLAEPEMIAAKVADCPRGEGLGRRRPRKPTPATVRDPVCDASGCRGGGASADGTLTYEYIVDPKGARQFSVRLRQDGEMREALHTEVAAS